MAFIKFMLFIAFFPWSLVVLWASNRNREAVLRSDPQGSPYLAKCRRLRLDGPTPCLCCPGECIG